MKHLFLIVLAVFVFCSCEKDKNLSLGSVQQNNSSVVFTDTVMVPINDLGTGTYFGFTGGLYPGGVDTPSGSYAVALYRFASRIVPLDTNGKPSDSGRVVFISIGASTGGGMMRSLSGKTHDNPLTNPRLALANCNNGAGLASTNSVMDPNDPYWDHVSLILGNHHISYRQVQVVYYETDDSSVVNSFPDRPYIVRDNLKIVMQTLKAKFKKLKLVYVLGRTTTFKTFRLQNQEPCPYYNGWGEKFYIEDQINGAPGTQYKGDSPVAPLVTWGWYQWANGTNAPRNDGFTWQKWETIDGLHATLDGQDTLSSRFQNFLLTDRYASIWYANHSTSRTAGIH